VGAAPKTRSCFSGGTGTGEPEPEWAEGKAEASQAPGAVRAPKQCRDKGWNRKRTGSSSDMSVGGARLQGNVRTRLNERSRRNSRGTVAAGQHPGARLRRLSPRIAMVQTAEAWQRSQSGVGNWSWLDRTSAGGVFVQGVVNAVLVVIADVLADDPTKVFFVHRDDVVEDLAAAAPNPSFGRSVLPWGVNARSFGFQSGGRQEANDVAVEDGIVIQNGVAIGGRLRKGFAKLLHDPICGRMSRDVEMQDSTAFVLDDEETVQHSETRGRNGEEVEADDGLAVVLQKCEPFLGWVASPLRTREIAGDGSLGQDKAELLQFSVDPRRAPTCILLGQAANQCAKFRRDPRPTAAPPGSPAPVQAEAGPMPAHHRFGFDNHQRIAPVRPGGAQDRPEQPIQRA